MPDLHAKLSPSSSARWMTCPGSVTLIETLADLLGTKDVASDPALKGTALHNIAEQLLLGASIEPEHLKWVDAKGDTQVLTMSDVEECVEPYVDQVEAIEGDLHVEVKVEIAEDVWGTVDACIMAPGKLTIIDLKTGHGKVDAADNTQLLLYALGAFLEYDMLYDFEEIEVCISQGRINHHDSYIYSRDDIYEFEDQVRAATDAIATETDNYVTSDKGCQWCEARSHCPALAKQVHDAASGDFRQMTVDALGDSLREVPMMKAWIKGVEDQVKCHLEKGDTIEGYKMVEGRRTRKWIDQDYAIKYFRNRVNKFQHTLFNFKFMSPAQVEKALKGEGVKIRGKVNMDKIVEFGGGQPTVAPEDDKRDALVYGDKAASDFAGIEDEDDDEDMLL
jgi:RecB family exonuclease